LPKSGKKQVGRAGSSPDVRSQRGLTLVETMVATIVAVLAVVGLAYSFGVGRGLIDRYQVARQGMAQAQMVVDSLINVPRLNLANGVQPFWVENLQAGTTAWTLSWVDDPVDRLASSFPADPNPNDLMRVSVEVRWSLGGSSDTLRMSRLLLPR
jgi:type II secretory pathway pseudopilin PulG